MDRFHKRPGRFRNVIWIAEFIAQAMSLVVLAVFCVYIYGNRYTMVGRSMEPGIVDNGEVLVDEAIYQVRSPKRFEVVVYEGNFGEISIKRVLALPGETIRIEGDKVWINGKELDCKEYFSEIKVAGVAVDHHKVEEDEYFLIGDWPEASEDSRSSKIGDIHIDQIKGRVWFCLSPGEKIGFIKN